MISNRNRTDHQSSRLEVADDETIGRSFEEVKRLMRDRLQRHKLTLPEINLYHINTLRQQCNLALLSFQMQNCMVCESSYRAQYIGKKKVNFLCVRCRARIE